MQYIKVVPVELVLFTCSSIKLILSHWINRLIHCLKLYKPVIKKKHLALPYGFKFIIYYKYHLLSSLVVQLTRYEFRTTRTTDLRTNIDSSTHVNVFFYLRKKTVLIFNYFVCSVIWLQRSHSTRFIKLIFMTFWTNILKIEFFLWK